MAKAQAAAGSAPLCCRAARTGPWSPATRGGLRGRGPQLRRPRTGTRSASGAIGTAFSPEPPAKLGRAKRSAGGRASGTAADSGAGWGEQAEQALRKARRGHYTILWSGAPVYVDELALPELEPAIQASKAPTTIDGDDGAIEK